MIKTHDLKTVVVNNISFNYFYKREKATQSGNPRYRVWIIDPDGPGVYETILTTYYLADGVKKYIEFQLEEDLKKCF